MSGKPKQNKTMQYDNEKRFVLFPKKGNANPKAPNYSGTITIDGKEWEINGWDKTSKAGSSFISGSIKEPFKKTGQSDHNQSKSNGYAPTQSDEDIPF